jgi:hypothetical protein
MKIFIKSFALILIVTAGNYTLAREEDDSYEGPSGKNYEYDLSDPVDRIMYDVDPSAQIRDSVDPDPRRELDNDLGRSGA